MRCPNCYETLFMMDRNQVEVDYCPSCRGVWLDRGELDKIIDHALQSSAKEHLKGQDFVKPDKCNPYPKTQDGHHKPFKKRSFLGDLFDFD